MFSFPMLYIYPVPKRWLQTFNIFSQQSNYTYKSFILRRRKKMANTSAVTRENFHARSNSLPSKSHPLLTEIEDHLCGLKGLEAASISATSICENLVRVKEIHEDINNLMQLPSIKESLSLEQGTNELLEGSIRLVDLCGFAREVVFLTKESVQELESSIRRNRGETASAHDIIAYMASRKKINTMVNKCIKNLKSFDKESDLNETVRMLKETEAIGFSILKSVLMLVSGEKGNSKQRKWSLFSKFNTTKRVYSEIAEENDARDLFSLNINTSRKGMGSTSMQSALKQLKASEKTIQEIEEGLEVFFRSLIKTRVSLLNILNH